YFSFNDVASTRFNTLSLHDALPIFIQLVFLETPSRLQKPPYLQNRENIEIRHLSPLGPTIQDMSKTSEDGFAKTSALCVNRLLLSLREILKVVRRSLVSLLRYPCPWARLTQHILL